MLRNHVRTVLPGFDPDTVIKEYLSGKYDHLVPTGPKSEIFKGNTITMEQNSDVAISPSGHKMSFDTSQVYCYVTPEQRPFYICFWCHRKFDWPFVGEGFDIVKVPKRESHTVDYIIPCKGTFCTFECHEGYLNDRYHSHTDRSATSRNIAHTLFTNLYPGQTLKPTPHFSMLNSNGGPLDEETFFSGEHRWITSGRFTFKPFGQIYTSTT